MAEKRLASIMLEMMNQQKNLIQVQIDQLEEFLQGEHISYQSSSGAATIIAKGKKKPKDPNQPKKYPSGYQIFIAENLTKSKEENPSYASRDIMAIVGQQWRESSEDTKKLYQEKSLALKAIYEEQMKEYSNSLINDVASSSSSASSFVLPTTEISKKMKPSSSDVETVTDATTKQPATKKKAVVLVEKEPSTAVSSEASSKTTTTAAAKPQAKASSTVLKPTAPETEPVAVAVAAAPVAQSAMEDSEEAEFAEDKSEKQKKDKKKSKKHKKDKPEDSET
jgi:hypothetical protein